MNVRSSDWKFLLLTAFVVTLLGVQAVRDAVAQEEELFISSREQVASRAPSAVGPVSLRPITPSLREAMIEWNWECRAAAVSEAKVKGGHLRLKGKSCATGFSPDRLSITNETNGFTASVFDKGRQEYETDLIQLRQGDNRIRVQYVNSSGKTVEKILTVISSSAI